MQVGLSKKDTQAKCWLPDEDRLDHNIQDKSRQMDPQKNGVVGIAPGGWVQSQISRSDATTAAGCSPHLWITGYFPT